MGAELAVHERRAKALPVDVEIPPCPAILTRLLREVRAEEPDFRRVGQLIGADVGLAAAIINIANSPYYGLRNKVATIQQAVSMLGLNAVTQRVTGLLLRQAFGSSAGLGMERYWKSSMMCALTAAALSRELRHGHDEVCHTYALFRDCGMAIMLQKFPIYADIFDGSALAQGDLIHEIEGERYGTTHAEIGARLASGWHLSEPMVEAIRNHHHFQQSEETLEGISPESRALIAIGLAAEQIYATAQGAACPEWELAQEWVLEELSVTPERLAEAAESIAPSLARR